MRYTSLSPLDEAKFGETPVHVAAAQGNLECLKVRAVDCYKCIVYDDIHSAIGFAGVVEC